MHVTDIESAESFESVGRVGRERDASRGVVDVGLVVVAIIVGIVDFAALRRSRRRPRSRSA